FSTGTAIGWERRRGTSGEYTRGGIRQADTADAWRGVGRTGRTANALTTAICAPLKAVSNVRSHDRTPVLAVKRVGYSTKVEDRFGRGSRASATPLCPRTRGAGESHPGAGVGGKTCPGSCRPQRTAFRRLRGRGGRTARALR